MGQNRPDENSSEDGYLQDFRSACQKLGVAVPDDFDMGKLDQLDCGAFFSALREKRGLLDQAELTAIVRVFTPYEGAPQDRDTPLEPKTTDLKLLRRLQELQAQAISRFIGESD